MKSLCLALVYLLCAACTTFENPIVAENGPVLDDALVGRWTASKDEGRLEIEIMRNGAEGKVVSRATEPGRDPETGECRLITARIERQDFGSLQEAGSKGWRFFRYELVAPDRLAIYSDSDKFWSDAIENRQVSGSIGKDTQVRSAVVTATSEELRAIVQGYGAVIFDDQPVIEFRKE